MTTVNYTANALDDDADTGAAVEVHIVDPIYAASPADPDNPTLAERTFVRVKLRREGDDGSSEFERTGSVHLSDSIPGLSPGEAATFRATAAKIYAAAKAAKGY